MPVVELSAVEAWAIYSEERVDEACQRELERSHPAFLKLPRGQEAWEWSQAEFTAAATARKRSLLSLVASSRVLPSGHTARLPEGEDYFFGHDPETKLPILAWGDVFALDADGRATLKPYTPLPRYQPPEEVGRLVEYLQRATPKAERMELDRRRVPDVD